MSRTVRVAMWSGPRNISTAMMRAWENREDTFVWDEPLYAYFLKHSGLDHPGAAEVIAAGEADWRKVVQLITGPVPANRSIFYQKHMTHHLLDDTDWSWLNQITNCFLIRDPREVLLSYAKTRPTVTLLDIGVLQQRAIFDLVRAHSEQTPLVMDARDVLEQPELMLRALCAALEVPFSTRMLSWPPGPRATDGVWAKYWYASVYQSSGFAPYESRKERLPAHLERLAKECAPHYAALHRVRIRPSDVALARICHRDRG